MKDYRNVKIEYHVLQSFPVTCLNRDDVGAPKTAFVGGVKRGRISSQCWKRQVRLALRDFDIRIAVRTKKISEMIMKSCSGEMEGHGKIRLLSRKIEVEPALCRFKQRKLSLLPLRIQMEGKIFLPLKPEPG